MKAEDTVMNRGEKKRLIIERSHQQTVGETQEEMLLEAQAEISFKAVTDALKKRIEGVKANAFSVSLFGSREHQLEMQAMVAAYDVCLHLIDECLK